MATVSVLSQRILQAINDPNSDEVAAASAAAGNDMMLWINRVCYDVSILTDCLQNTGTITGNGTLEAQVLPTPTSGTTYWRTLSVTDRTNGIKYMAIPREQYQDHYIAIVKNSASGLYVYNLFGYGSNRKMHVLPILGNGTALTVEFSETHPTITYSAGTETPSGILAQYDTLIIEGVKTLYFQSCNDETNAQISFAAYMDWVKRLASEVGTNPVIDPEMSSLYRFIYKAMKEVKG